MKKPHYGTINIELEDTEYIIDFVLYPYIPKTFDSQAEGGDWEIDDVRYVNEDKFHKAFDRVPDKLWQPLEDKYHDELTEHFVENANELDKGDDFPPCIGCGYCCLTAPCFMSVKMGWQFRGDCEMLFWNGERYLCQAIIDRPEQMEHLGVGAGCPSTLCNDYRENVKEEELMDNTQKIKVLDMIAEDAKNDAIAFDGKPFNGKTVAEYLGYHGAAIASLANIMKSLIKE